MARIPRSLKVRPGYSVHKVWRGHNREPNLGTDEDKTRYLTYLVEALEKERPNPKPVVEAFTLMDNHGHEVMGVHNVVEFSEFMRRHHAKYGADFNRRKSRCGKVAQDRPWTTLIGDDLHAMETTFYVHANPLRAGIVRDARNYRWSTHNLYAFGHRPPANVKVVLPNWYLKLGKSPAERQRKYRQLFQRYLKKSGLVKQSFLRRVYFGPSAWVAKLQKDAKAWRREREHDSYVEVASG